MVSRLPRKPIRSLLKLIRPLLAPLAPSTPELKHLLVAGARVQLVADGFGFVEGPVWHRDGYLLFSDIPRNRIMKWHPTGGVSIYREPSQHANGLTFDRWGRLFACEHATRRVSRTENDSQVVTAIDKFEGKRLNSPNDLVFGAEGSLYFSDPPYGLPNHGEGKDLEFNGVFRLSSQRKLMVIARDFEGPNGIALSPDQKTLYVADSGRMHVRAFDVQPDGSVANSRVFAELQPWVKGFYGVPDGMKVDLDGHIYVAGPGGVWVFDAKGKRLGVIVTPEVPANCSFGDADLKTLYITAQTSLYRIRVRVAGLR